jgi:chemotaxis protein methyltransferase CheR
MLDALSTHQTSFFREPQHFDYLGRQWLPARRRRRLRLWSAGCASGAEPYSMAITLLEAQKDLGLADVKILATDLSRRCVAQTSAGVFSGEPLRSLPEALLQRYFEPCSDGAAPAWRVRAPLRRLVFPARLNLAHSWPLAGPFDAIFCCNVMIYLTPALKRDITRRFASLLRPGGILCLGASETLTEANVGLLHYVQPTIYERPQ